MRFPKGKISEKIQSPPPDLSSFKSNVPPGLRRPCSGSFRAGVNREFVSLCGADHPYRDSSDHPDRDSDHPGRDEQNIRSGPISRTIQS